MEQKLVINKKLHKSSYYENLFAKLKHGKFSLLENMKNLEDIVDNHLIANEKHVSGVLEHEGH